MQSIYRESTENNLNVCLDSVKREDHSVVSLRVHTNIHSGLTKIVSVRPVKERPVIDVFKRSQNEVSRHLNGFRQSEIGEIVWNYYIQIIIIIIIIFFLPTALQT